MIKLTGKETDPYADSSIKELYINKNVIIALVPSELGTVVYVPENSFWVKESPQHIMDMLR